MTITATTSGGAQCTATSNLTVAHLVDLSFEVVSEDDEESKGGFVCTYDHGSPLPAVILTTAATEGTVDFSVSGHKGGIQLYQDAAGTIVLPVFNQTFDVSELPKYFYVKGFVVSPAARDITFTAVYDGDGGPCEDTLKLTVLEPSLKSIRFSSDHGLMRENILNYEPTGTLFPEPEWDRDRKPQALPISHTMGIESAMEVAIEITTLGVSDVSFLLVSEGPPGLAVAESISLNSGSVPVMVNSAAPFVQQIQAIDGYVEWTLSHNGRTCMSEFAGADIAYVTVGTPRDTADPRYIVTEARMARAVQEAGAANSLDPHEIIEVVIQSQGNFDLGQPRSNAWLVPDFGGDCQSIIRFGQKVANMIDIPGTFDHKNIYAIEAAPAVGIEAAPPGGLNNPIRYHPNGIWKLYLVDSSGGCNAFEAVAKFTACGQTRFYPGGVSVVFTNKDDVLRVFQSLSWISADPCHVEEDLYLYPAPDTTPIPPVCP